MTRRGCEGNDGRSSSISRNLEISHMTRGHCSESTTPPHRAVATALSVVSRSLAGSTALEWCNMSGGGVRAGCRCGPPRHDSAAHHTARRGCSGMRGQRLLMDQRVRWAVVSLRLRRSHTTCHRTPHHTTPHHTTPHHAMPHHTTPHHTTPQHCTTQLSVGWEDVGNILWLSSETGETANQSLRSQMAMPTPTHGAAMTAVLVARIVA
jgi:hypothetical protein